MRKTITMPYYWSQEDLKDLSSEDIIEGTIMYDKLQFELKLISDQDSIDFNKKLYEDNLVEFATLEQIIDGWESLETQAVTTEYILALNKARIMYTLILT